MIKATKRRVFQTFEGIAPPRQAGKELPDTTGVESAKALSAPAPGEETAVLESATAAISEEKQVTSGEKHTDLHALDEQIERDFLREAQMLDMGGRKHTVLRRKLSEKAQKEPEMVSQLIRSWIQER